jgi:CubicO group peptidase (beta-lactamase class C family)/membrane protease YdiL (CAAX protease family)
MPGPAGGLRVLEAASKGQGPLEHEPRVRVVPFFLISHGFSWTCWTAAMLLAGSDIWSSPARWLVYVGGVGPLLAGLWMTWQTGSSAGLRRLARRVVDPRLIPVRWLAIVLLLPVVAMAAALGVAWLGGALPEAVDASRLMTLLGKPVALLSFAAFVLIFGPLPEEIGWRGYGLDALQARVSALSASLLLGLAWALWHAPLFFIAGYFGDGGSPEPILFTTAILVNSVLYTVIHNHTGRSVLAAILFHFMINFVGMLVEGAAWVEWTRTAVTAVAALVAVAVFGGHTLGRSRGLMAALVVTLVVGACSRSDAPVAGEPVDAFVAHMDRRVPQLMQQYDVPGLAVVLVHKGSPVWSGAYGYADVARQTVMTTDAVFRAESISKAVTAWGVLRLVESGRIRLDDDVRRYVVDLMPDERHTAQPVTIRRLLNHNAGMPLGPVGPPVQFAPGSSMPDLRSFLAPYAHPVKEPGSGFMYSNVGFNLLELVGEEVTGRDFADYIRAEVLLPLGMRSSSFQWQAELQPGMATGYDLRNRAVPSYVYPARAADDGARRCTVRRRRHARSPCRWRGGAQRRVSSAAPHARRARCRYLFPGGRCLWHGPLPGDAG